MKNKKTIIFFLATALVFSSIVIISLYLARKSLAPVDNQAAVPTFQEFEEAGLYSVLDPKFGTCRNDGVTDCTRAIQAAIDMAYSHDYPLGDSRGAVLFPTGDYLISDTLVVANDRVLSRMNAVQLIGSTESTRPRLILKQGAFTDANGQNDLQMLKKKAMIHFYSCDSTDSGGEKKYCEPGWSDQRANAGSLYTNLTDGNPAMNMANGIRNMEFVIKSGNPDSIAIRFAGAQDNILANIKITFESDGFAGIYSFIGTNSVVENVAIIGGQYGFIGGDARWPSLNNIKLFKQKIAAISASGGGMPISISGFYIEKDSAPAIADQGINFNYYAGSNSGGAYALSDGVIKILQSSNNPVIENKGDRQISMRNVTFVNSPVIIKSNTTIDIAGVTAGSKTVGNYANMMPSKITNGIDNRSVRVVNGVKTYNPELNEISTSSTASKDLMMYNYIHGVDPARLPSPDVIISRSKLGDPKYIYLKHKGVTPLKGKLADNAIPAEANIGVPLQAAINSCASQDYCYILIGKGRYPLKQTIELGANTHLFGVTNYLSEFVTNPSWKNTTQTTIFRSPNDPRAKTTVGFFRVTYNATPKDATFNIFHWRSGKDSLIYGLLTTRTYRLGGYDYKAYKPRAEYLVNGNGGGRWYGITTAGKGFENKWIPNYRGVKIENTTSKLVIYGLDPEDGGYNCLLNASACKDNSNATMPPVDPSSMQVEIRNASHVEIRGFKCEDHNSVHVYNSKFIFANGIGGCTDWYFENVQDYVILNMASKFNSVGRAGEQNQLNFEELFEGKTLKIYKNESISDAIRQSDLLTID